MIRSVVNDQLYFAILIALGGAGLLAGRWRLVLLIVALWILGLAIAALAGAFHRTDLDTGGALFFFAAFPTMLWVLAFALGTAARKAIRWVLAAPRSSEPHPG
jgi:hypothetical protein